MRQVMFDFVDGSLETALAECFLQPPVNADAFSPVPDPVKQ
jgi:hypothetical protein